MEQTQANRQIVLNALAASKVPMSLRDVMAASGLRRGVVNGALYRLRNMGCVEIKLTQGGYSAFAATGKTDEGRSFVRSGPITRRKRAKPDKDALGVEMLVRVLDADGNLIELSLAEAMEVERQLSALRAGLIASQVK